MTTTRGVDLTTLVVHLNTLVLPHDLPNFTNHIWVKKGGIDYLHSNAITADLDHTNVIKWRDLLPKDCVSTT